MEINKKDLIDFTQDSEYKRLFDKKIREKANERENRKSHRRPTDKHDR